MNSDQLAKRVVDKMYSNDGFSAWLGIEVVEVSPGSAVCKMLIRKEMLNGFGSCHGGITFSLADSAFAFAANTHGRLSVALEVSISYPVAVHEGDELCAVAREMSLSEKVGIYDVTVSNQKGEVVGLFRGTVYRTQKLFFPETV